MLFNIGQESYISGKGSIFTDMLPDVIKEEVTFSGTCIQYNNNKGTLL